MAQELDLGATIRALMQIEISDLLSPNRWIDTLPRMWLRARTLLRPVASRRPPEALAPGPRAIGPTVVAKSLRDALDADTIILAVPFGEHREVARSCRAGKARRSSTRRTRLEFFLKSWTASCAPPSLPSRSPALSS
jgi:hypothetical protein